MTKVRLFGRRPSTWAQTIESQRLRLRFRYRAVSLQ